MSDIIKKKQHYLPKAYLRFFATPKNKTAMIYAYFLATHECKYVSIDDICFRNYLYEQKVNYPNSTTLEFISPNELEDSFIENEGNYASLVKRLVNEINCTDTYSIAENDLDILTLSLSLFQFRNPLFVNMTNYISEKVLIEQTDIAQSFKSEFPDIEESIIRAYISHEFLLRMIDPQNGILVSSLRNVIQKDQLCILRSNTTSYITSDSPIINIWGCRDNVDYDILGMPITPNLFIAFIDSEKELSPVIDVDESDVKKLNEIQINRKAPRVFLSCDNNLSDEKSKQTIENIEVAAGMELCEGVVLKEETLAFYNKMKESIRK